jgi:molybdate transport system substrate-binding protein
MTAPLKIISSMATKQLLAALGPQYTQSSGQSVVFEAAGGVDINKRVRAGEAVDVVVLAANAIDQLIGEGHLVAASRVDLVKSGIAIAVRQGAARPDVGSEEAVKRAVLAAGKVSYSTGPSGVYLEKLFERWGIAEEIKPRLVLAPPGVPVGALLAKGEADLGFQQLSELKHLPGLDILGPLPPAIQLITTFSAGVSATSTEAGAVRAMLDYMNSPAAVAAKQAAGMEPVHPI